MFASWIICGGAKLFGQFWLSLQFPEAVRAQNVSGVDRFQNTGFLFDAISAIKKFLENLYERISRVDWKVSILSYRFPRNFFIAEIASDYGLVRIDFKTTTEWFLEGRDILE